MERQRKDALLMVLGSSNESASDTRSIFGSTNDYAQMFQMIVGFGVSQIVHNAAVFSLAEHLAQGPKTAIEIAEAELLDGDATFRLMRAFVSLGLMTFERESCFVATSLLQTLHRDAPNSL